MGLLLSMPVASAQNKMKMENLNLTNEWDKIFPQSDKVEHSKITFHNRYGINLRSDIILSLSKLYKPPSHTCVRWGA